MSNEDQTNDKPLFRLEALRQQRARLHGDVIITQPPTIVMLAGLLSAIMVSLICFLIWGEYARKETVTGYLSPGPGVIKVYSPRKGIIESMEVREGDFVEKDAPLFSVAAKRFGDATVGDIDRQLSEMVRQQLTQLGQQIDREWEMLGQELPRLEETIKLISTEITALNGQMARQQELVDLARQDVEAAATLQSRGHESDQSFRQRQQQLIGQRQQWHVLKEKIASRERLLSEARYEAAQAPLRLESRVSELERLRSDLEQKQMELSDRRLTTVRAPISGYVSFVQAAPGRSVPEDLPVLAIVPDGSLLVAELFVPSRAIGFVEVGQEVRLLYDAFPYQKFGSYRGVVSEVAHTILSRDEIPHPTVFSNQENPEPVFRVIVTPDSQQITAYGKLVPLHPGISLQADIIFDRRALYEWALEPFYSVNGRLL